MSLTDPGVLVTGMTFVFLFFLLFRISLPPLTQIVDVFSTNKYGILLLTSSSSISDIFSHGEGMKENNNKFNRCENNRYHIIINIIYSR